MTRVIRWAVVDDAAAMGRAHVRAWQAAYRGVMPDDYLDGLSAADREAMWRRRIESTSGRGSMVAVVDGAVVGCAAFGPCADDPGLGELYSINLDPRLLGTRRWSRPASASDGSTRRRRVP